MKFICGPMATISHPAFRILIEEFGGCDEYFTEMINAGTLIVDGPFEKYYLNPSPVPQKLVWQLTGFDIDKMEEASRILVELPGLGLDLNMGCSAPAIYKTGAGISWMIRPSADAQSMVHKVRKVVDSYNHNHPDEKKRLSVKLRLGEDNFTDDSFFSFTDMLVNEGVELLTLHPRTKKEKLSRPPRYFYCQKLAERYKNVSVYLNGNIKDKESFDFAVTSCPDIAGVMISRAAVQKPWIFKVLRQTQKIKSEEKAEETFDNNIDMLSLALDYIENIQLYQPPEFWKTRLQRFFLYYAQNFKFSHYAQTQFINAKDISELEQRLNEFFEKCPDERFIIV
ncbi:MAG: tRNA-dihydrouridine synthase family protein [Treponema sp.]|nr:tRNA-dihydrouridine synthase family protein [Treponema sp.]